MKIARECLFQVKKEGDPVTMSLYVKAMFPLLHLKEPSNEMNERTKRLAFADDFTGAGKLQELRLWWDNIVSHGPNFGYYREASKSWLTLNVNYFDDAIKIF